MSDASLIAIIPAAGLSRRMGQPKLLLPWRGSTVIAHLVGELRGAGVCRILVVVRASDLDLATAVESTGATLVRPPVDPPDMRSSVEFGLQTAYGGGVTGCASAGLEAPRNRGTGIVSGAQSGTSDKKFSAAGWLLIPADHPLVSRSTVDALRAAWEPIGPQILIPTHAGKRGHPTLFSSDFAAEVSRIPVDYGLNWLVKQHSNLIREVPVSDPGVVVDLDTPDDYQKLLSQDRELP